MRTWKSLAVTLVTFGSGAMLVACGDDSSSGSPDARRIDASDTPDAEMIDAMPSATRAMTIAVTDVAITSPQAAAAGLKGGVITIDFEDLTQGGGEVLYGTTPIGGCLVTKYTAANGANPTVGAGAVTIGAPETGTSGLLKPVGPCGYTAGVGYNCVSDAGATAAVTATALGVQNLVTYSFTDTLTANLVGSYLNINGLTAAGFNSGASAFPIVGQTGNVLTVIDPAGTGTETGTAAFAVLNGAGPIPTAGGANADFLGDETTAVRVQKDADANWPAIDFTVFPRGEGFTLADESAQPHQFPDTAQAVTFACAGTGFNNGDCGADNDTPPSGTLRAMIVSGRTTDVDVTGTPDYYMPPASAATEYTAFQCAYFALGQTDATSVSLPMEAVAAIESVDVTRIETRVLRVAGTTLDGPTVQDSGLGKVLVGHGLVGHTTVNITH
ncbi:MAG: hypothetical protein H6709_20765 [Kofleriaceae bacterium]|nr:hypothetical protein [Myxococcales bacterium]MCB9561010.1 hypothetical protein [Kofleriaceae bacterium]MCB9574516.1 hypothetical protein [Kofleriaceae bacterium]